jgi:hypothetical protein
MILARGDLELLKRLEAAGERGCNVREAKTRVTLGSHSAAKTPL